MVGTKEKIRCIKMSSQTGIGYMHQQISGIYTVYYTVYIIQGLQMRI